MPSSPGAEFLFEFFRSFFTSLGVIGERSKVKGVAWGYLWEYIVNPGWETLIVVSLGKILLEIYVAGIC